MLETIQIPHFSPNLPLYINLYQSVQNAPFLRQQLLDGNAEFEYAFIDASMIVSRTHILAACFRAMNDYLAGRLKSKNVHSEIVFALSPNNNMLDAFRKFGIQDSTTNLLVIKVPVPTTTLVAGTVEMAIPTVIAPNSPSKESIENHLHNSVQGIPLRLDDDTLQGICDVAKVRKAYKISPPSSATTKSKKGALDRDGVVHAGLQNNKVEIKALERAMLGAMALRGAT